MSSPPPESLVRELARVGQEHLLRFWPELTAAQREHLVQQIGRIDLDQMAALWRQHNRTADAAAITAELRTPSDLVRQARNSRDREAWQRAERKGEELLAAGRVAAVLVAGGQGTRLGFPHPKGMYPIGPVSDRTLFGWLAEGLLAQSRRFGVSIPYLIMTSEATHAETLAYFEEQNFFGLDRRDVYFFQQASMPALDAATGRILMAEKHQPALSPDGHGGLLAAMRRAGLFDELRRRGIDLLFYHQVDNPTVLMCEPAFLGWHAVEQADVSVKVVPKRSAQERMGVVVEADGFTRIVEYSDLPAEIAAEKTPSGELRFWAGSTAIHVFNREFLERMAEQSDSLGYHRAVKKVPHVDDSGRPIEPKTANALKFERFIFDVLPHAQKVLVVEADRSREFNPVKNASGDDSPAEVRSAMSRIFRQWLSDAGVSVADDAMVEISPLFALDSDELRGKLSDCRSLEHPVLLE